MHRTTYHARASRKVSYKQSHFRVVPARDGITMECWRLSFLIALVRFSHWRPDSTDLFKKKDNQRSWDTP